MTDGQCVYLAEQTKQGSLDGCLHLFRCVDKILTRLRSAGVRSGPNL